MHKEGYDRTEPRAKWIFGLGLAMVIVTGVLLIGVVVLYEWFRQTDYQELVANPIAEDLINLREREDAELNRHGYIDKNAGTVRISIQRAMDLLASEYAEGKVPYPTSAAPVKAIEPEELGHK
jgi:hypothetical protein